MWFNLLFLSSVSRSKLNGDWQQSGEGPCKMWKRFENVPRNTTNVVLSVGDSMIYCKGNLKDNSWKKARQTNPFFKDLQLTGDKKCMYSRAFLPRLHIRDVRLGTPKKTWDVPGMSRPCGKLPAFYNNLILIIIFLFTITFPKRLGPFPSGYRDKGLVPRLSTWKWVCWQL